MTKMEDVVMARWEGINGGPFIDANELLAFLRSNVNFNATTLREWMSHMRGVRLDQIAEAFHDTDVPGMRKDLLALRDELAEDPSCP